MVIEATLSPAALDDPKNIEQLRRTIEGKPALRMFYREVYSKYRGCLASCLAQGKVLELGSGGGFLKNIIPEAITSDVLPYQGVDQVVDATQMPFEDQSLRAIFMMNVLHHIPNVEAFFQEAQRTLAPGGRIFIVDQNKGWISTPILKYAHHEPFNPGARTWSFESTGPLSGANGALAWIVFQRDLEEFRKKFPELQILQYRPHSPLRYWLTGGLKKWCLLPGWAFPMASCVDSALSRIIPPLGSFLDIELEKKTV